MVFSVKQRMYSLIAVSVRKPTPVPPRIIMRLLMKYSAGTALMRRPGNGSGCAMKPQCHVPITQFFVMFVHT